MTSITPLPHPLIETIAGFLAGIASTLVAHPLDVLKTRLQVDRASSSHAGTSLRLVKNILKNEGTAKGFYRGLSPNLAGNSISWALYFLWYSRIKAGLQAYYANGIGLSYHDFFLASGFAGALTAVCTNPIWVIKTRMLSTASHHPGAYRSISHGTQQIYRAEGVRGFYRGLIPSLFGVSHGALQFMAYEQFKRYRASQLEGEGRKLSTMDYLWHSGASKVFAGSVTYPYQVVRSRLQMYEAEQTYKGARDAIAQTWKQEGLGGFYKGLGPNLVRVLPSTWITFLVYEKTKEFMPRLLD
ncbi:MAG: hypothetical protein L6R38_007413 [Xanthoria sp. 2 TBL-2021]|nr:MAG: hypothetical protein L6R38_007413 [Xanthoria sp. 2 TBL-2021]